MASKALIRLCDRSSGAVFALVGDDSAHLLGFCCSSWPSSSILSSHSFLSFCDLTFGLACHHHKIGFRSFRDFASSSATKVVASASIRDIEDSAVVVDSDIANSGVRNQVGSHSQAALACLLQAPASTQIGDALRRFGRLQMATVEAANPSSGDPPALD